jgi:hypothetical protein
MLPNFLFGGLRYDEVLITWGWLLLEGNFEVVLWEGSGRWEEGCIRCNVEFWYQQEKPRKA